MYQGWCVSVIVYVRMCKLYHRHGAAAVSWLQSFVKPSLPSQRLEKFVQIKYIIVHAIKG